MTPLFSIVRGDPSPQELAALLAVLTVRLRAAPDVESAATPLWAAPLPRAPLLPGPGAWRASGLPR